MQKRLRPTDEKIAEKTHRRKRSKEARKAEKAEAGGGADKENLKRPAARYDDESYYYDESDDDFERKPKSKAKR